MSEHHLALVIGTKTWSSWSLRPWLVLKRFGIPFEEICIPLRQLDTRERIVVHSPAGKVPVLKSGPIVVWDSLAIIEHVADLYPAHPIWPKDRNARAIARAVAAEMHSGFAQLREHCPMDFNAYHPMSDVPEAVERNVRRIIESWRSCRAQYGGDGPFLFSEFSAADAMYAPVCSRFRTYLPDLSRFGDDGTAARYVETIFAMPEMIAWGQDARREAAA